MNNSRHNYTQNNNQMNNYTRRAPEIKYSQGAQQGVQNPQYRPQQNLYGLPLAIGSDNQYILYHSNEYSNYCKEFTALLCKTPDFQKFTKIDVCDKSINIPPFVKSVPTIIVPKINRPLVGDEAFKWLEDKSKSRIINEKKSITPYSPGEMACDMGDNYSFLDIKDTEQPMEHTFSYIKRNDQKINTPDEQDYSSAKPKTVRGVNSSNRTPFPQAPQRQAPTSGQPSLRPPMIPSSSSDENLNVDDAYNNLLSRRKMDILPANGVPPR